MEAPADVRKTKLEKVWGTGGELWRILPRDYSLLARRGGGAGG